MLKSGCLNQEWRKNTKHKSMQVKQMDENFKSANKYLTGLQRFEYEEISRC